MDSYLKGNKNVLNKGEHVWSNMCKVKILVPEKN